MIIIECDNDTQSICDMLRYVIRERDDIDAPAIDIDLLISYLKRLREDAEESDDDDNLDRIHVIRTRKRESE